MASFAELDENNIVLRVIKINNEVSSKVGLLKELYGPSRIWKQTHYSREDYAGIGWYYDSELKKFIPPKEMEDE
jgi:hypothetical protein